MLNRSFQLFLLVAGCSAGWGAYSWVTLPHPRQTNSEAALFVTDLHKDIGMQPWPGAITVEVKIRNRDAEPHRIVGIEEVCGEAGCVRARHTEPMIVPPRGEVTYSFDIRTYKEGPFEMPVVVFLDDGGMRKVTIVVTGESVASAETGDGPKLP